MGCVYDVLVFYQKWLGEVSFFYQTLSGVLWVFRCVKKTLEIYCFYSNCTQLLFNNKLIKLINWEIDELLFSDFIN